MDPTLSFNFKMADWKRFREGLKKRMTELREPGELEMLEELEEQVEQLTKMLQKVMEEVVPKVKSSIWRSTPDHPLYREYKALWNKYADAILDAKKTHWQEYLEQALDANLWTAN
ncbi:hypothetical protein NP233_g1507 [Leucocoprinus birnbaumii]|uniref:Uncharacterized protein n=1 Tax=Leucocoprinus birnbaumii TaxID=56174 RepID=A0AAD5YZL5_9AGAR|nr:hypothetical protein NP233_g1507 [Leucocoprinus birnbaumii]